MESTPDVGVAIRKESTGPRPAPAFRNATVGGMTPQEQSGNGMPKIAALITEAKLFFPK